MTANMPDSSGDDPRDYADLAGARQGGRRLALLLFIAFAVAFVGSSATQIVRAVFPPERPPLLTTALGSSAATCAEGIALLVRAIDRATESAKPAYASALDGYDAVSILRQRLGPEWDDRTPIERACSDSPEGLESWAALLRFREAVEQWVRRESIALGPLRRDVIAHVPANLR